MADGDPQATGPDSGLDLGHFDGRATAFVLKCWEDEVRAVTRIKEAVRNSARPVIANVSVLEEHRAANARGEVIAMTGTTAQSAEGAT
ncbi:hypothetical protein [Streptomyces melanosporofaciens]|uniref:hypothetical protein n=1 Tax=Streptomyces melanosporofaciens TaxID=67327 RepID=UPI000B85F942|nr:hypothetical protein [Streptomyces melanosporofaciens]